MTAQATSTARRAALAGLLLSSLAPMVPTVARGGSLADYDCPDTCVAPSCVCPSIDPPGGLAPEDVPQLVLLSFTGALTPDLFAELPPLWDHENPNGCAIPATFFVTTAFSDPWATQQLWAAGHEIADHTVTRGTGPSTSPARWEAELRIARDTLTDLALVPANEVRGFRAPFLFSSDSAMEAVDGLGLLYDSSLPEGLSGFSLARGQKIWPYSLDFGIAQECVSASCPEDRHAGVFEVPVYTLDNAAGGTVAVTSPGGTQADLVALWQENLLAHLGGNRAPFALNFDLPWLVAGADHIAALDEFLGWALDQGDVWIATHGAAIDYLRSPVRASAAGSHPAFSCTPATAGSEVCDGADNDGDGAIDEGLVRTCSYSEGSFQTCATCPGEWPHDLDLAIDTSLEVIPGGLAVFPRTTTWDGGFCADLRVENDTDRDAFDWRVGFTLEGGVVNSMWSATYGSAGSLHTVTPQAWNAPIPAGESALAGLCVDATGSATPVISEPSVILYGEVATGDDDDDDDAGDDDAGDDDAGDDDAGDDDAGDDDAGDDDAGDDDASGDDDDDSGDEPLPTACFCSVNEPRAAPSSNTVLALAVGLLFFWVRRRLRGGSSG